MKRKIVRFVSLLLLFVTVLLVFSPIVNAAMAQPLYVVHCPGGTPDGKHHFKYYSPPFAIHVRNSQGKNLYTMYAYYTKCIYCNWEIYVCFTNDVYMGAYDLHPMLPSVTDYWIYEQDVHSIESVSMVFE